MAYSPYGTLVFLIANYLKGWAYEVTPSGQSVAVHHPSNVGYVCDILKRHGHEDVHVYHCRLF
jgi:hypothetical protein